MCRGRGVCCKWKPGIIKVEQALRPVLNLIFYHFNCSERLLKSHHVSLVPVVAACSQLLLKSVSKLFENVEWSNSLLRHFKIQTFFAVWQQLALLVSRNIARFFHFSLETEFNALRFINHTIPRLCSTYAVATMSLAKLQRNVL